MNRELIDQLHSKDTGKLSIVSTTKLDSKEILSAVYTPGVGEVCKAIVEDSKVAKTHTIAGKMVAVVSDGTAVLGFGNIGPKAALPVMEGKCAIFKEFAGVDAFPICLNTQDPDEIIKTVINISPNFAAINLEDIAAPNCFYIENKLTEALDIPIMHDDQHGTAIVALAALKGALKLTGKKKVNIVVSGAGAAGTAIAKLLSNTKTILDMNIADIKVFDSKGFVSSSRTDLNEYKLELATFTNQIGDVSFENALKEADVFVGVSAPGILTTEMVKMMHKDPIVFALANPDPEILPEDAKAGGASIVATGRSDFPNQINNALAYPGVFKGLIQNNIDRVTEEMKLRVADAIYLYNLPNLTPETILPSILDTGVVKLISESI